MRWYSSIIWLIFSGIFLPEHAAASASETPLIDSLKIQLANVAEDKQRVRLYNDLAWEYALLHFDSAGKYTTLAIDLSEQIDDPYWKSVSREMQGLLYEISGQQEEAIRIYLEVIELREQLNNVGLENTFNNLAILFRNQKNHRKALEYFTRSYQIEQKNGHQNGMMGSLINMANSYKDLGLNDSAFILSKEVYQLANENQNPEYQVLASINMAKRYYDLGHLDSTWYYSASVLAPARELNLQYPLATLLQIMAEVRIDQQVYQEALDYLLEAETISSASRNLEALRTNYASQARILAALQKFDRAFESLNRYVELNDSIINRRTIEVVNELELRYETAQKDKSIAELNALNSQNELAVVRQANQKRAILFGSGLLILVVGSLAVNQRQRLKNQLLLARKNEEIRQANFQKELTELELKALRAQMNPHFIFNCLNSINTMILNGNGNDASRYLGKFSRLIRLSLEHSESGTISLEEELTLLETYIQLESVRFQGRIGYEIRVDEEIDQAEIELPAMVLQPFVENAIWHGLMHKPTPGKITIDFSRNEECLLCTIEDDGVGRAKAGQQKKFSPDKKQSMGIRITEDRLKLTSTHRQQDWVRITDLVDQHNQPAGTRVEISIPLN